MFPPKSLRAALLLLAIDLSAAAPPLPPPPPATPITTSPAAETPSPSPTTTGTPLAAPDCDYRYCDGQTSWCFYWAGVTGWDPSLGPVPGEVRTSVGLCGGEDGNTAVSLGSEAVPTD